MTLFIALSLTELHAAEFRAIAFFSDGKQAPIYHKERASGAPTETQLPRRNLSKPQKYQKGKALVFGVPDTEVEGGLRPLVTLSINPTYVDPILVFLPTKSGSKAPYGVIAVDGSWSEFKAGDLYFINLSKTSVKGFLGEKKVALIPRQRERVAAPTKLNKDNFYYVNIRSYVSEKHRPLFKGYWPVNKGVRRLVFVFDDPKNKVVRFMGIPDTKKPSRS